MIRRRSLLSALPAVGLLATGCAPVAWRLAGGGGEEGGIGGTGVFGTVTGLGSVLVNGLRLETWAGTAIESLARRGAPLLPGDVVAAEAVREPNRLLATRLAVFHPLIGPLAVLPGGGFAVLGTRLVTGPDLAVRAPDGATLDATRLRGGEMVAVSGIWRGDVVLAGSLLVIDGPPRAVLRGQLRREGLALVVGGTRLDQRGQRVAPPVERFVTVQGRPGAHGVIVEWLAEQPLAVFAGAVTQLSVEGVLAANRDTPGFHLSGFGLPFDPTSPARPPTGQRQLMLGSYGQAFRIEAGLALPPEAEQRAAALRSEAAATSIRRWLAAGSSGAP